MADLTYNDVSRAVNDAVRNVQNDVQRMANQISNIERQVSTVDNETDHIIDIQNEVRSLSSKLDQNRGDSNVNATLATIQRSIQDLSIQVTNVSKFCEQMSNYMQADYERKQSGTDDGFTSV